MPNSSGILWANTGAIINKYWTNMWVKSAQITRNMCRKVKKYVGE